MNNNSEKIKIGLLAMIAITLIVQTFYQVNNNGTAYASNTGEENTMPVSDVIADNGSADQAMTPPAAPVAESTNRAKTTIKFESEDYDFGKIRQDTENKKLFKFTNTGTEPLVIENAVGSCGCTVPDYPKEPIAPGKTGEIIVKYSPGKQQGKQTKTVTITANTDPITTILSIHADVQEVKN